MAPNEPPDGCTSTVSSGSIDSVLVVASSEGPRPMAVVRRGIDATLIGRVLHALLVLSLLFWAPLLWVIGGVAFVSPLPSWLVPPMTFLTMIGMFVGLYWSMSRLSGLGRTSIRADARTVEVDGTTWARETCTVTHDGEHLTVRDGDRFITVRAAAEQAAWFAQQVARPAPPVGQEDDVPHTLRAVQQRPRAPQGQ